MTGTNSPDRSKYKLQILSNNGEIFHSKENSRDLKSEFGFDGYIEKFFDTNLYLYYEPEFGKLVCYFQGTRNVGQQMYALYQAEPSENFLQLFKDRLRSEIQDTELTINDSATGAHDVFRHLGSDNYDISDETDEQIRTLVKSENAPVPHKFGAPDSAAAMGIVNWLLEEGVTADIAIGGVNWAEDTLKPDILIRPWDTEIAGSPIAESLSYLEKSNLKNVIQKTKATINNLAVNPQSDTEAKSLADNLNKAGLTELGLTAINKPSLRRDFALLRNRSVFASFILGIAAIIIGATVLGEIDRFITLFTQQYQIDSGTLLVDSFGLSQVVSMPAWIIILGTTLILGANLYSRVLDDLLSWVLPEAIGESTVTNNNSNHNTYDTIVNNIELIQNHDAIDTTQFGGIETVCNNELFNGINLDILPESDFQSRRRRHIIIGSILGLIGAVATAVLAGLSLSLISPFWRTILSIMLWAGLLGIMRLISIPIRAVLPSRSKMLEDMNIKETLTIGVPLILGMSALSLSWIHIWQYPSSFITDIFISIAELTGTSASNIYSLITFSGLGTLIGYTGLKSAQQSSSFMFLTAGLTSATGLTLVFSPWTNILVPIIIIPFIIIGIVILDVLNSLDTDKPSTIFTKIVLAIPVIILVAIFVDKHILPVSGFEFSAWLAIDFITGILLALGFISIRAEQREHTFVLGPSVSGTPLPVLGVYLSDYPGTKSNDLVKPLAEIASGDDFTPEEFIKSRGYDQSKDLVPIRTRSTVDGDPIDVLSVLHKSGLIEPSIAERVDAIYTGKQNPRSYPTFGKLSSDMSNQIVSNVQSQIRKSAIARAIADADQLVLVFPIDPLWETFESGRNKSSVSPEQITECFETYRRLLTSEFATDTPVYAVGVQYLEEYSSYKKATENPDPINSESFRQYATEEIDDWLGNIDFNATMANKNGLVYLMKWQETQTSEQIIGSEKFIQGITDD